MCMDHALTKMLGFRCLVAFLVKLLLTRTQQFFRATAGAPATAGALVASV